MAWYPTGRVSSGHQSAKAWQYLPITLRRPSSWTPAPPRGTLPTPSEDSIASVRLACRNTSRGDTRQRPRGVLPVTAPLGSNGIWEAGVQAVKRPPPHGPQLHGSWKSPP